MKITRRGLLISGAALGGGLVLGFSYWPEREPEYDLAPGEQLLNAFVKIGTDGKIIIYVPQAEMGQGITTGLPTLLADELDADWDDVAFEFAPIGGAYANTFLITEGMQDLPIFVKPVAIAAASKVIRLMEVQVTGGSTSIRHFMEPVRKAGAAARHVLIAAAAQRWGVAAETCRTENSHVIHDDSARSFSYGELASDAALISPPDDPQLKSVDEFKFVGRSMPRLDMMAKVTGTACFGIDVRRDGMVYAAVRQAPASGGRIARVGELAGEVRRGVIKVVNLGDAVAVIADGYWQAQHALNSLDIDFSDTRDISSAALKAQYRAALDGEASHTYRDDGDMEAIAVAAALTQVDAEYEVPYLAHSCMEPMNATAHIHDGLCDIWLPTQAPALVRDRAADAIGLDKANVNIHPTFLGGGFGRRSEADAGVLAARVAAHTDHPVQVIWSREEDIRRDAYRPMAAARLRGYLTGSGDLAGLDVRGTCASVSGSFGRRNMGFGSDEPDPSSQEGIGDTIYHFDNFRFDHVVQPEDMPVGYWRSVGNSFNAFFLESFLDEMAVAGGMDPFNLRRKLVAGNPRALKVLDVLQEKSAWDGNGALGAEGGRGMAFHASYGAIVGQVMDVRVIDGQLHMERLVSVVDCGFAINLDTIEAQIQSAAIYGLSAAVYGEINLEAGEVVESNFHDYDALRLRHVPQMDVHIISDGHAPSGIGEPGTPPAAPALTNAIYAATGERIRALPISQILDVV